MKTKILFFAVIATAMLGNMECFGQSNMVFYGANSNALGVAFVDTNLTASARTAIVADLQVCLREWGKSSYVRLDLGADEPGLVGYLERPSVSPHWPKSIEFPEGLVSNATSGLSLQISMSLSNAYTNAFAFATVNSNAVAAAYEFVAFVTSSDFAATVTSDTIHNYVLVKDMTSQYYQSEFSGIMEGLFQYPKYYPPSLLGFYHSANGPGTSNLYMTLPTKTNPGFGYDEWVGLPAIWHDNKWKVCLGYEWVP